MAEKLAYAINNLKFAYSREVVLDIEKLELEKGKISTILGPNGSGKTTLLKIFNNLLHKYDGHIIFENTELREKQNRVREKSIYVHQNPLLLNRTVFENIYYGLKLRGYSKKLSREMVEKILDKFNLVDFKDRSANMLSGGEMRKVALARAIVCSPEYLLLDEPTAEIDRDGILKIVEILNEIKQKGTSVIISTHNLSFAFEISDEVILLENGRIMENCKLNNKEKSEEMLSKLIGRYEDNYSIRLI